MEAKFKVGDIVTINFIPGSKGEDYPFTFVEDMQKRSGQKVKIKSLYYDGGQISRKYKCFFDGYLYRIEGDPMEYNWSSSMFLEAQEI